jgi:hypothetical protein
MHGSLIQPDQSRLDNPVIRTRPIICGAGDNFRVAFDRVVVERQALPKLPSGHCSGSGKPVFAMPSVFSIVMLYCSEADITVLLSQFT